MRESEKKCNSNKVYRVKFEDLIYDYENKVKEITKFLGFTEKDHVNKKSRFNPDISIKNTQLFRKKEYLEESRIIEEKLKDYLYDFPYEINNVFRFGLIYISGFSIISVDAILLAL